MAGGAITAITHVALSVILFSCEETGGGRDADGFGSRPVTGPGVAGRLVPAVAAYNLSVI
jgi:hypothetical protein